MGNKVNRKKVRMPLSRPEEEALRGLLAGLPEEIVETALRFAPFTVSRSEWQAVRAFVLTAIAKYGTRSRALLDRQLYALTRFTAWCFQQGIDLTIEDVFEASTVERWAALGRAGKHEYPLSPHTLTELVSRIRSMGRSLNPDSPWPVFRETGPDRAMRGPYSEEDLTQLLRGIKSYRRKEKREWYEVIVALGLGCGLKPHEFKLVKGSDVRTDDSGVVSLHIPGRFQRTVPIAFPHDAVIAKASARVGNCLLISSSEAKNSISSALQHHPFGKDVPRISVARLRTTWLVQKLAAGVDARTLFYDYAGLTTLNQLVLLTEFLPLPDADKQRKLMCTKARRGV